LLLINYLGDSLVRRLLVANRLITAYLVVAIVVTLGACRLQSSEPSVGFYRAALNLPGGEAPVALEVAREQYGFVLYFTNGNERTRVSDVQVADGKLHAVFPGYENSLDAAIKRTSLDGVVTLIKHQGVQQAIPFHAELGDRWRFFKEASSDNVDVSGRWEVQFTDDAGKTSSGIALIEQQHDRVTGTVMTPTGDHRFLEGQVRGDEAWLSTFAGGLAYLYKVRINSHGELEGEYWQGLKSHEKLTAKRNAEAELVDATSMTGMKSGAETLDFTFRDLDGKQVSLSDAQFRGKVVLVTLGGSWCPNCHDEAMFLAPFYKQNRDRGFEVIALMFERHGDFDKAAQAVRRYRHDLDIQFPTLIAGISDTDDASKALPTLTGIYGFPTSIFIDRQGHVRRIHTGFTGPATGHYYADYVQDFRNFADELLAESADAATP
jgi:peroxiredoxin